MPSISPMYIAVAALAASAALTYYERQADAQRRLHPLPPSMEACLKRGDKLVLDFKGGTWGCEAP